jgi:hypothetical protein
LEENEKGSCKVAQLNSSVAIYPASSIRKFGAKAGEESGDSSDPRAKGYPNHGSELPIDTCRPQATVLKRTGYCKNEKNENWP